MEKKHFIIFCAAILIAVLIASAVLFLIPGSPLYTPPEPIPVEKQEGVSSDYWAATPTPFADVDASDIVSATVNFNEMPVDELSEPERAQLLSILKKVTVTGIGNDDWKWNNGSGASTFTLHFADGSTASVAEIDGFFALDYVTYQTGEDVLDELSSFYREMHAKYDP